MCFGSFLGLGEGLLLKRPIVFEPPIVKIGQRPGLSDPEDSDPEDSDPMELYFCAKAVICTSFPFSSTDNLLAMTLTATLDS